MTPPTNSPIELERRSHRERSMIAIRDGSFRRACVVALTATAMLVPSLATGSVAAADEQSSHTAGTRAAAPVTDSLEELLDTLGVDSDHVGPIVLSESEGVRIELRRDVDQKGPEFSTQAPNVGLGWSIYVYMTGSEVRTYVRLGSGLLASLLCGIGLGPIGVAVCGVIATEIVGYGTERYTNPQSCYEFKFNYAGSSQGAKTVSGNKC
ncbi:MAG: hypothetical protein WA964_10880 [Ilumatobacter sp.]|uniref:hypothetical protein n=1 Tax=Ilumatobacter sp. TaxID=1967498 RepID=UPI003C73FA2C